MIEGILYDDLLRSIEELCDKYDKKYDEIEPKLEQARTKDEYNAIVDLLDAYGDIIRDLRQIIQVEKRFKERLR